MPVIKDPPPFDSKNKPYNRYKVELDAWTRVTKHEKETWGHIVALSLPEDNPSDIRNKVFDAL